MNPSDLKDEHKPRHLGFWSWTNFRDASLGLLMIVIAARMAFASTNIDLSGFNFTDLLSLILAISAIGLSAAFYFKADESSRGFYNNSYQFTKEVSEILGRIEAGFGQQLAHINEGYAGLNRKIDSMPFNPELHREQEEAKKAELAEQEAKRADLIEDLMRRAQMDDEEKRALSARLNLLQLEVEASKAQLSYMSNHDDVDIQENRVSGAKGMAAYLAGRFALLKHAPDDAIYFRMMELVDTGDIPKKYLSVLSSNGFLFGNRLSDNGLRYIKSIINN